MTDQIFSQGISKAPEPGSRQTTDSSALERSLGDCRPEEFRSMEGLGLSLVAINDSAPQTTISAIVLVVLQPAAAAALRTKFRVFYIEPLPRSNVFWNADSIERNDLETECGRRQ